MNKYNLGRLKKVELRDVWKHEAKDFSEWLASPENIELLAETLGIEIEVIDREVEVGKYRIDILAKENYTENKIIIENQLEVSNHDHLGKIITYAAGLDAKYIIWILKDVRDEHLKAIQWLNDIVTNDVYFFLVKIELWKINNSDVAPSFEILSTKNNWVSTIKNSSSASEIKNSYKEQHEKHYEFWLNLESYMKNNNITLRHHKPRQQHWLVFPVNGKYGHIAAIASKQKTQNKIGVSFDIKENFEFYDFIKEKIEKEINFKNDTIIFYKAEKDSGFRIFYNVEDVFDKNKEAVYFEWILERIEKLNLIYSKYILEFENISE